MELIWRLRLKLPMETKSGSPNDTAITAFQQWYAALCQEMGQVYLLSWRESDQNKAAPIAAVSDFPTLISDFRAYVDKVRPRSGKTTLWSVVRIAFNGSLNDVLSGLDSAMSWYYSEIKGGAYSYEVQSSEDAVEVGVLAYTSNHTNQFHLEKVLTRILQVRDPVSGQIRPLKFGVVPKMHKDFPKSDQNWDLPTERPLIIYADRADAKEVRRILYQAYNREPDFMKRPGYLNSRLIPSKDFLSVGSDSARNRECLIQKHQQVLLSVRLLRTTDIKELDLPVVVNGVQYTLREELLQIRHPLGSSMADTSARFFFGVDWADRGRNLEAGTCYLPVYSDRLSVATTFTRILPVYISDLLGPDVVRKWFQPSAIADCQGVALTKDDDGLWTGGWTTDEDAFDLDLLAEDMGGDVTIDFSGATVARRSEPDTPALATADDATAYTFGAQVFGRASAGQQTATQSGAEEPAPQGGEVAPTESSAAAAPSEDPPAGGRPAGRGGVAD